MDIVCQALKEDIGAQDITTQSLIPEKPAKAVLLAKDNFIVCGLQFAAAAFKLLDKTVSFHSLVKDGTNVQKGAILARISANAGTILTAERTALNFLSFLSAISTKTNKFVRIVKPYKVKIMDTRKTIPGLRLLQKYAVRIGGGFNHRMSLEEMVIVKDNHLKVIGGYKGIQTLPRGLKIDLEVEGLAEFKQALKLKPDIIMLDNMSIKNMKKAVQLRNRLSTNPSNPRPKLEASGGINLKNVRKIASTDVDMISVGSLTSSVEPVDISLEIL